MRVLDQKLLRDLYRAKGLLFAITSILSVGVMCFVSMRSVYHNLESARRNYYRQCNMADFWLELKKAPTAELASLSRIDGIARYDARIQFRATINLPGKIRPANALVLSLPRRREAIINNIVLRQGDYFTNRRQNEIIVNESFARQHHIYPGQSIVLLLNNRRQEFFVVGTAISSEFTYLLGPGAIMPDPENYGVFYIQHRFAEEIFDFEGATNQVVGQLSPTSRARSEIVLRQIEAAMEPYGVLDVTPLKRQPSHQFLTNEIQGLGAFATVVPTIFLAVAALVLNVLINRLTRQQRTIVGTLKALGYTNWQIFAHFIMFGLTVGVAGAVLGSLLGYACSAGMTWVYQHFFEFPDLRNGFYWYTHAVGLLVSLLCAVLGAFWGSRRMLKLQPAEAMRSAPPERGRAIWLERFTAWWNRLTPAWKMAIRSVFRHRQRSLSGLFAACMGAGLLVNGFMMTEAQNHLLDFQFQRVQRSDVDLTFEVVQNRAALDEVRRLPGVDYAEPILDIPCTLIHGPYRQKGAVTGLLRESRLTTPRDQRGEPLQVPAAGLVLTRQLAEKLKVVPGDRLTLQPTQGNRRPVQVPVALVADSYLGLQTYAEISYLSRLIDEEFALSGVQLATDGAPQHQRMMFHRLAQMPGVQAVISREEITKNLTETLLKNQFIFIGVLVGFAGIIFFGSIVNASIVSLAERQREVATFRAMGYTPWQVGGIFLRENLLVNLTGALLGAPVGYGLMWITAQGFNNDLMRIPVVSAPWIWGTTLLLSACFALLAHGVVQWTIYRMDFLEALKVKE